MWYLKDSQHLRHITRLIYLAPYRQKKFNCFIKAISFISTLRAFQFISDKKDYSRNKR